MRKLNLLLAVFTICSVAVSAQTSVKTFALKTDKPTTISKLPPSKVDFDAFESLAREVKEYRKDRLVSLPEFLRMSTEKNTIILDTRSTEMYNRKHIKGAVHLNFTDFNVASLAALIANTDVRILIYCNNNFATASFKDLMPPDAFVTKGLSPKVALPRMPKKDPLLTTSPEFVSAPQKGVTLALNIPTFINLYGYGYKNVYELGDLVPIVGSPIIFEGTDVAK